MFVSNIKLLGFRNYLEANIDLSPNKTIIIGKNAQGKTNLLEVIQILSHLKSRRVSRDIELVNFKLDDAFIVVEIIDSQNEETKTTIALQLRKNGRRSLKINDVKLKPKELLHHLYSVSFMAEDLEIINGSPSDRRSWLDSVICQLIKNYNDELDKFDSILQQRNAFLKKMQENNIYNYLAMSQSEKIQLGVWDDLFLEHANQVTKMRDEFFSQLNPLANAFYKEISGSTTELLLHYCGQQLGPEDLIQARAKDFARAYTNVGPHRDDVEISLNGNIAASFASQGEKRSIILALKLAELELLQSTHHHYPLLLLDDVLAELDEDRQDYLLQAIKPETQVIITTTHLGKHLEKWSQNAEILEVDQGQVRYQNFSFNE